MIYIFLVFIYLLITSEILIPPYSLSGNISYEVLGYLNPIKYFVWTNMLVTSYQFIDKYGITQILPNYKEGDWVSFKGIYITIPFEIIFIVLAFVFYKYFFRIGVKN
ncbi:hypothetical protein [Spiroplasma endosymbiont of Cantharis nigra]|uniref:hypothetical protein n=1 Tax=Spiroplasma endosymbiont of Cantharis nigra TaxID=3066278 RepID=UPI0030D06322